MGYCIDHFLFSPAIPSILKNTGFYLSIIDNSVFLGESQYDLIEVAQVKTNCIT
jgi:hypothetical protein